MLIKHKKIVKFCEEIEKIFSKYERTLPKLEDIDLFFEGPNMVFNTGTVKYALWGYKFKQKSSHKEYKNLVCRNAVIIEFRDRFIDKKKLEILIEHNLKQAQLYLIRELENNRNLPEGYAIPSLYYAN